MILSRYRTSLGILAAGIVLALVWMWAAAPTVLRLPQTFSYEADVISVDNFYDEEAGQFSGEERTVTTFTYRVLETMADVAIIENMFDVRTILGDPVFAVTRTYGVNRHTWQHQAGHGDKDRDGFLFAPVGAATRDGYTYWHINYDTPAQMVFVGHEHLNGLPVMHFRSQDLTADQTGNLGHLPGVGTSRGVRLAVDLETWIEPTTGYLVKYQDHTEAVYYDLASGAELVPWNTFRNSYTSASVRDHVRRARTLKVQRHALGWGVPLGVVVAAALIGLLAVRGRQSH